MFKKHMKLTTTILIILFALPGFLTANPFNSEFSANLDPSIKNIASGGLWEHEGNYGNWRLISRNLGWDHTRSYLYIQWLKTDDEKQNEIELMTIPIREFNMEDWRNIISLEYKKNTFLIYYSIRPKENIEKAILVPDVPGKYKLIF